MNPTITETLRILDADLARLMLISTRTCGVLRDDQAYPFDRNDPAPIADSQKKGAS
jgi:hypothetical protein